MYRFLIIITATLAFGYPQYYETQHFKVGIEYDNSLPMSGGSDRFRHKNNYDPFFVTVTASAKKGYVISYIEVSATADATGEMDFTVIYGRAGTRDLVFQLVSNNSQFLTYSYMAYGIREEEYKKVANIVTIPTNKDISIQTLVSVLLAGHLSTPTQDPSGPLMNPSAQTQPDLHRVAQMGCGSAQDGSQAALQMSNTSLALKHSSEKML
ncbi:uncharacterized protein LOC121735691 [Aricia agestis]|uniref:uncharacterized protein LOC121735691 n=1 Tax=Aricia agestis TaxID=91739 RepID=UPI001C20175C|nr:uncharacterized protein LOC121735691 [Aricia agestis]